MHGRLDQRGFFVRIVSIHLTAIISRENVPPQVQRKIDHIANCWSPSLPRRQLERTPNFKCLDRSPNAICSDQLSRIPSTFVLPTRPPAFATTGFIGHPKNFHLQSITIV
ncbi:uncharacterized protein L3040_004054 [Drepanopeziza brunnea f. sp. 'multigermtubi']|uniref:uncharacterized protein n=1 Tax=Drepanopeziza brunnea f. sp. 'multigermtubi' TaxID=698441 RepID=UPI00239DB3D8|nr:hypothetical protein L3040_004054 [Drepanopeziza brunnea f. sp. 'multigermtubi']